MHYTIIIEETSVGYSAYSPDILGCVSAGTTVGETTDNMREAIEFHLDSLREDGEEIPKPLSSSAVVEVR